MTFQSHTASTIFPLDSPANARAAGGPHGSGPTTSKGTGTSMRHFTENGQADYLHCANCGKLFEPTPGKGQIYCPRMMNGVKCVSQAKSRQRRVWANKRAREKRGKHADEVLHCILYGDQSK